MVHSLCIRVWTRGEKGAEKKKGLEGERERWRQGRGEGRSPTRIQTNDELKQPGPCVTCVCTGTQTQRTPERQGRTQLHTSLIKRTRSPHLLMLFQLEVILGLAIFVFQNRSHHLKRPFCFKRFFFVRPFPSEKWTKIDGKLNDCCGLDKRII